MLHKLTAACILCGWKVPLTRLNKSVSWSLSHPWHSIRWVKVSLSIASGTQDKKWKSSWYIFSSFFATVSLSFFLSFFERLMQLPLSRWGTHWNGSVSKLRSCRSTNSSKLTRIRVSLRKHTSTRCICGERARVLMNTWSYMKSREERKEKKMQGLFFAVSLTFFLLFLLYALLWLPSDWWQPMQAKWRMKKVNPILLFVQTDDSSSSMRTS